MNAQDLASKPIKWLVENLSLQELNELKNTVQLEGYLPGLIDCLMGKKEIEEDLKCCCYSTITFLNYRFETWEAIWDKFSDYPGFERFIYAFISYNNFHYVTELWCLLLKHKHPFVYDPKVAAINANLARRCLFSETVIPDSVYADYINNSTVVENVLIPMLSKFDAHEPSVYALVQIVANLNTDALNKIAASDIVDSYKSYFILRASDIKDPKVKKKIIQCFTDKITVQRNILPHLEQSLVSIRIDNLKEFSFKQLTSMLEINLNYSKPLFIIDIEAFTTQALAQAVAQPEKAKSIMNLIKTHKDNFSDTCIQTATLLKELAKIIQPLSQKELFEYIYSQTVLSEQEKIMLAFITAWVEQKCYIFHSNSRAGNSAIYDSFTEKFGTDAIEIVKKVIIHD